MSQYFIKVLSFKVAAKDSLGLIFAISILSLWVISLIFLLPASNHDISSGVAVIAVLTRTFLHTGLFVVTHESIHRNLIPKNRLANEWIGRVAIFLYACLSYNQCRANHFKHHRHPAQDEDPDFHDGLHCHPINWYFKFIKEYISHRQLTIFVACWAFAFFSATAIFQIPAYNLFIFWLIPFILSSFQLFYFGTYLPHKKHDKYGEYVDSHQPNSSQNPLLLSFITCYHFDYHWEHHEYPDIPWYRLPDVHFQRTDPVVQHGRIL